MHQGRRVPHGVSSPQLSNGSARVALFSSLGHSHECLVSPCVRELAKAFNKKNDKGEKVEKGIAFPTCISLNRCVCVCVCGYRCLDTRRHSHERVGLPLTGVVAVFSAAACATSPRLAATRPPLSWVTS